MHLLALDRVILFVAFIGGLWVADMVSDDDGTLTITSIVLYGVVAILIGFIVDLIRHRFCK